MEDREETLRTSYSFCFQINQTFILFDTAVLHCFVLTFVSPILLWRPMGCNLTIGERGQCSCSAFKVVPTKEKDKVF